MWQLKKVITFQAEMPANILGQTPEGSGETALEISGTSTSPITGTGGKAGWDPICVLEETEFSTPNYNARDQAPAVRLWGQMGGERSEWGDSGGFLWGEWD